MVLGSLLVLKCVSLQKITEGATAWGRYRLDLGQSRASPSCLWRRRACRELTTRQAKAQSRVCCCLVTGGGVRVLQLSPGWLTRAMAGGPPSLPSEGGSGSHSPRGRFSEMATSRGSPGAGPGPGGQVEG